MKLMIAGSRSIDNIDISQYIEDGVDFIISGGAKGIDTLAEQYADKHRISKIIIRPRYDLYKKNAPLIRNKTMVDISDNILVLWDGKSRGAKSTIEYASNKGKEIKVVKIENKSENA